MDTFPLYDCLESEIVKAIETLNVLVMEHALHGIHIGFDPGNRCIEISALPIDDRFMGSGVRSRFGKWAVGDWEHYNFTNTFTRQWICDWPDFKDLKYWMEDSVESQGTDKVVEALFCEIENVIKSEKFSDVLMRYFDLEPDFELCIEYYQGKHYTFTME